MPLMMSKKVSELTEEDLNRKIRIDVGDSVIIGELVVFRPFGVIKNAIYLEVDYRIQVLVNPELVIQFLPKQYN